MQLRAELCGLLLVLSLVLGCGSTAPAPAPIPSDQAPGAYAERYAHLPDMGPVMEYMQRHDRKIQLDRGYYRGDWIARGRGYQKRGANTGETVIDGDLEVRGSGWIISKLTVTGDVTLLGDDNDVSRCEILGRVRIRGVGNKAP